MVGMLSVSAGAALAALAGKLLTREPAATLPRSVRVERPAVQPSLSQAKRRARRQAQRRARRITRLHRK